MRRVTILSLAILCTASLALAQVGGVGIYSDAGGMVCNLWDLAPGLQTFYIVHVLSLCTTGSQFSAPVPACYRGSYVSDTRMFPLTVGNSQTGVTVGYGAQLASPITVMAIHVFNSGLTPRCCLYPVLPAPSAPSGRVEITNCSNNIIFGNGGAGIFNRNPTCTCTVATEETTWSRIKSMYAN